LPVLQIEFCGEHLQPLGLKQMAEAEGFVLAGGRSTRMGQDKALIQLAGKTLVELALDKLRCLPLAVDPRVAGAASDFSSHASVIPDLHPACGPLSGMEAALGSSTHPLNVFLPVDLPLLPACFLAWMLMRAEITGAVITVPRIGGELQPLCAVYHRSLLDFFTASLLAGNYKVVAAITAAAGDRVVDIFDTERVVSANPALLNGSLVPPHRWFHNCNTPEDLTFLRNALVLDQ
jgi:molybdopterin-guanine dinucleotide biosynthesis protein A